MQENKQNISPIKQRILQFIETLNISKRIFYSKIGVSRGTLESKTGITEDIMAKFIAVYPEISLEWLIMGQGNMLKFEAEQGAQPAEPPKPEPPQASPEMLNSLLALSKELGRAELQIEYLTSALKQAEDVNKAQIILIKEYKHIIAGLDDAPMQVAHIGTHAPDDTQEPTLTPTTTDTPTTPTTPASHKPRPHRTGIPKMP